MLRKHITPFLQQTRHGTTAVALSMTVPHYSPQLSRHPWLLCHVRSAQSCRQLHFITWRVLEQLCLHWLTFRAAKMAKALTCMTGTPAGTTGSSLHWHCHISCLLAGAVPNLPLRCRRPCCAAVDQVQHAVLLAALQQSRNTCSQEPVAAWAMKLRQMANRFGCDVQLLSL